MGPAKSSNIYPLESVDSLTPLLEKIGDSRYVLLGSASHGTREFFDWRARLTERLIAEKGFSFVALMADWPECYQVNRFVKLKKDIGRAVRPVLRYFNKWPTWKWGNEEMEGFVRWLLKHNKTLPEEKRVGFYGLDQFSLWETLDAIMTYMNANDPLELPLTYEAYRCYEPKGKDPHAYSFITPFVPEKHFEAVLNLLVSMREKVSEIQNDKEDFFRAQLEAETASKAREYYSAMLKADRNSRNERTAHVVDTLEKLMDFHGSDSKVIVWAHNTHMGDARATETAKYGLMSTGQMLREKHGDEGVYIVGFGTYQGEVISGQVLGAPISKVEVPQASEGSWEHLMHTMDHKDKMIFLDEKEELWSQSLDLRAMGVVYNPMRDFINYTPTVLAERFDAFMYFDKTQAIRPISNIEPKHEELLDEEFEV